MPADGTALRWRGGPDGQLILLDQTLLPARCQELTCRDEKTVAEAIRHLRVRGAPAIGVAAAYGVVLGLQSAVPGTTGSLRARLEEVIRCLAGSRPTAVNLFWALERMRRAADGLLAEPETGPALLSGLLDEARAIQEADVATCLAIGTHGSVLLEDGHGVLTHCNAGALATSGRGTALSVIYAAHESGKRLKVFADETRPLLQGARLTCWELLQQGIDTTLICDSMAAPLMREGRIHIVLVGADRIAANGDTANKIGTYGLAVLAHAHQIPFFVAAPCCTWDLDTPRGEEIPIELRCADEVTHLAGHQTAPEGVQVHNPAFDITPARLITGFISEHGVFQTADQAIALARARNMPFP
jgi:methylthioribose-1-phosphate isomerase